MKLRKKLLRLTLATVTLFQSSYAFSQAQSNSPSPPAAGGIIGLGVVSMPVYQGAERQRVMGAPLFEYRWSNGVFVGGDGLLGYQVSRHTGLQYGLLLGQDLGRKERDALALAGLGDVEERVTAGGFAKASLGGGLLVTASLQAGSGNDHAGALLNMGISYQLPLSTAVQVRISVNSSMANREYMASYFGVSEAQSDRSGYQSYHAEGGLRDASLALDLVYPLGPRWLMIGSVKSTNLLGSAIESPLVRRRNDSVAMAGIAYTF